MTSTRISPRIVTYAHVAKRLGICVETFKKRYPELICAGFPPYDTMLKGFDIKAVEAWIDKRSLLAPSETIEADNALAQWRAANAG